MQIKIEKKYLELPVSVTSKHKKIVFSSKNKIVYDLDVALCVKDYDFIQYVDMSRFIGETLDVEVTPQVEVSFVQTDSYDMSYAHKFRPQMHFSAQHGWINDPNGLCFVDGKYHMFYQFNPAGPQWGNMHWGHAVSEDLVTWQQLDTTLYPDEMGTMFSGSGIIDINNVSGLKTGENAPYLLFYTAAGNRSEMSKGKEFTQCLAFSNDNGKTFTKYEKNPIIENIAFENRDPKVVYVEECNKYYMALYLIEQRYALLSSDNLINWEKVQELEIEGDAECPDLYPLYLDGNGEKLWVLTGAWDKYLLGRFNDNGIFEIVQKEKSLQYTRTSYAAQSFSDVPNNRRIKIAWNRSSIPNSPFNCAMTTPVDVSLKTINNSMCVCVNPLKEIKKNYKNINIYKNVICNKDSELKYILNEKAQDITLIFKDDNKSNVKLKLLGFDFSINMKDKTLNTQKVIGKAYTMPIASENGEIKLRFITDTNAIECYANKGEAFICVENVSDYSLNYLSVLCENEFNIDEVVIAEFKSIWNK